MLEGSSPEGGGLGQFSPVRVERLLAPLPHEGRVRVMQALGDIAVSAKQLSKATGFRGGALYHHLKELEYAGYVASERDRYRLTKVGRQLLLTVLCMANEIIRERGEQGLSIRSTWLEEKPPSPRAGKARQRPSRKKSRGA